MTELDLIRRDRMAKLQALGPRPPWYRPFKRKVWRAAAWKICTITARELTLLVDAWVGAYTSSLDGLGQAAKWQAGDGDGKGEVN